MVHDPELERQWRRELKRLGVDEVRRALMHAGTIPNVDREFAEAWLTDRTTKLIRWMLFWERVRLAMLAITAIASVIMLIEVLIEWLG